MKNVEGSLADGKALCRINGPLTERLARAALLIAAALSLCCFVFVFVLSLTGTAMLDPDNYWSEHILFSGDNLFVNLASCIGLLLLAALCKRAFGKYLTRIDPRLAAGALAACVLVFGAVYVSGVSPEVTADGRMIMRAAEDFHNGDFSAITTTDSYYGRYFHNYQYQLGLALYFELLIKVFGAGHLTAMALTNVALYAAACAAIVLMAGELYSDKRIAVLTALLLAAFLQPVLYCGLLYGPVPGYAFSVFSALCFVLYLKRGRRFLILPMALFAAAGAALKINCMIYVIAMAILLMIDALGRKRLFSLLGAALLIGAAVLLPKAIVKTYEARAGAALSGSGTPALNWVVCGLSESDRAPGWYFDQPYDYSPENIDESKAQIARDLAGRLMRFQSDPAYAAGFFYKKQLSLWDEPTYQSVWVTRIKKLEKTMPPLVERIYTSSVTGVLYGYFRYQVQGIYLLIVLGLLGVIGETKRRALSLPDALCRALIPTVLLGAFLYHFVAEAKSQYVLLYVAFALPCAAAGLLSASDFIEKRILFRAKRGA